MPTNWVQLVRDLTAQGATPTQYGAQLARIKTVCAWCGKLICDGELVNGKVSHGICRTCDKKFRQSEGL